MTGVYRPAVEEWEQELRVPIFAPRLRATPIPGEDWNTGLVRCFHISEAWIPHILGVMEALDQPDTWIGTDEEIEAARQNVREIMIELARGSDCELDDYVKYIGECNSEGLLVTQVIGGVEATARINITDCLPPIPDVYIKSIRCEDGDIEYDAVAGDTEQTIALAIGTCLDGVFLKPSDLTTPQFEIVGNDLWVDLDADGDNDLNLGRVVGQDGADGANAPEPSFLISNGHLFVDTNGDDNYTDLGNVKGDPGECPEDCAAPVVPPPVIVGQDDSQTRCNVAGYIANVVIKDGLQEIVDDYNATGNFVNAATGIVATLLGAAGGGVLAGIIITAVNQLFQRVLAELNTAEELLDDDLFFSAIACQIYCALDPDPGVTEDNFPSLVNAIRTTDYPNVDWKNYLADFVEGLGAAVISQATTIGAIVAYDCTACDCEEPGVCSGADTIGVVVTDITAYPTDFVLPAGCCYRITWSGNVRVGGTAGSPLMGDGNRQQVSAGNWGTGGAPSGDILQWNNGATGWQRIPTTTPYNPAGYSVQVVSTGVALQLRWSAANYTNNSGTMTVTVTGEEC